MQYERDSFKLVGSTYRLRSDDCLAVNAKGFYCHKTHVKGVTALDYLVKVRGVDFKEAVTELAESNNGFTSATHNTYKNTEQTRSASKAKPKPDDRPFVLPTANEHNNDVITYLKGRGINETIIQDCIKNKSLYQDKKQCCIFVGYDNNGTAKYAAQRSTKLNFKGDATGSKKAFNFLIPAKNKNTNALCVFESPIDAMSHASIAKAFKADMDVHRLSLGGVSALALKMFLDNNKNITKVYLCLDNDIAGLNAIKDISSQILFDEKYKGIKLVIWPPSEGKDYNEMLLSIKEKMQSKASQSEQENFFTAKKENEAMSNKSNKKVLECSSKGDKRFSAMYAKVEIFGVTDSIENHYQKSKRDAEGRQVKKGQPVDHFVLNGRKFPAELLTDFYRLLWIKYLDNNPGLVEYARKFDEFTDMFRGKNTINCQADVIRDYIADRKQLIQSTHEAYRWDGTGKPTKPRRTTQTTRTQNTKTKPNKTQTKKTRLFPITFPESPAVLNRQRRCKANERSIRRNAINLPNKLC